MLTVTNITIRIHHAHITKFNNGNMLLSHKVIPINNDIIIIVMLAKAARCSRHREDLVVTIG